MNKSNNSKKSLKGLIDAARQFVGNNAEIFVGKNLISPKFQGVIVDEGEPILVGDPLFSGQTYLVIQVDLVEDYEDGIHKIQ